MSSITIVTDTDASLPAELAAQYGIRQVPISVLFDQESFRTGIDIDDARLFARVDREGRLPTTSAPSPGDFEAAFRSAFEAGADTVICFCVSSEVSGTYGAALAACELMAERDITVVDSRTLSLAQGWMAVTAAEAARQGLSKTEIVECAVAVGERIHLYAALATVKYLAMSGRVGRLAAGMANLLNVKPILTVRHGKLDLLERVRSQKKAWDRVIELAEESLAGRPAERVFIVHTNAYEDARRFEGLVRSRLPCPEDVLIAELTPGLSVHTGSGLVGLAVLVGE